MTRDTWWQRSGGPGADHPGPGSLETTTSASTAVTVGRAGLRPGHIGRRTHRRAHGAARSSCSTSKLRGIGDAPGENAAPSPPTRPPRRQTAPATPPPTLPNPSMATERPSQPDPDPDLERHLRSRRDAVTGQHVLERHAVHDGTHGRRRRPALAQRREVLLGRAHVRPRQEPAASTSGRTSAQNRAIRASLAASSAGSRPCPPGHRRPDHPARRTCRSSPRNARS